MSSMTLLFRLNMTSSVVPRSWNVTMMLTGKFTAKEEADTHRLLTEAVRVPIRRWPGVRHTYIMDVNEAQMLDLYDARDDIEAAVNIQL
jgi:hypothetical protein